MSSEAPVPLPRTAVPLDIDDPVERARAELKAALAAIDEKANLPRRAGIAIDKGIDASRAFARSSPALAAVAVITAAAAAGAAVWGIVRLYTR
ncbi:hypothetical protein P0L94_12440 [Microbacter sp. GSS18]|nr:hypothetical protein P0L94_12440 [Microbacter sp. GSS18]